VAHSRAVFHPKVIFLKSADEAYLITGSANLSIAAWSSNYESVVVKKIDSQQNANEVISFFDKLGSDTKKLSKWASSLKSKKSDWRFIYSLFNDFNLFDNLDKCDLTIWSPYFSKSTNKLLKKLQNKGFGKITLVPDITPSGKIRIIPDELELIKKNNLIKISVNSVSDENQELHHAKVWLTASSLAVGSWNCSYRATGLDISDNEKNIEAGVIIDIDQNVEKALKANLDNADLKLISGLSESTIDEEWEMALNPFYHRN